MRVDEQKADMRRQRWTSRPCFAKSISIKNGKRRSDDCAWKAAGITPGDLSSVVATRLGESRDDLTWRQKSAEGVVCAEQRVVQEGRSPSGARMRSAVSKSGGNASLAGERGRYG